MNYRFLGRFIRLGTIERRHGKTRFAAIVKILRIAVDINVQPVDPGPARRQIRFHLISEADVFLPAERCRVFRRNRRQPAVEGNMLLSQAVSAPQPPMRIMKVGN